MATLSKKNFPIWAPGIIGFSAIVAQVQFIRELLTLFLGNEIGIGTILGVWLIWTAIGSAYIAKIFKRIKIIHFVILQAIQGAIIPINFLLIRSIRIVLGITLGEMMGLTPMILLSLLTLGPFCLSSGLLYTISCQLNVQDEGSGTHAISKVYLLEAIGSGLGGLVMSFILLRVVNPAVIVLSLSWINLSSALILYRWSSVGKKNKKINWLIFIIVLSGILIQMIAPQFQKLADRFLWKGHHLVKTENSIYGNIGVTKMADQLSFYENGLLIFTVPDPLNAEHAVHFGLLEHPNPKTVLLIGGGLGGAIGEILKHPSIEEVHYVELNKKLISVAKKLLKKNQTDILNDPRVNTHILDGRQYIKTSKQFFDVIILNLPNPYTARLNRFYTLEFFHEIQSRLHRGGIFSLQVLSSENVIGPELSQFLSSIGETLRKVFKNMIVIPGEMNRFIVSEEKTDLTENPNVLIKRLKERQINTLYVREYYFPHQMSEERLNYLKSKLHPVSLQHINRDFKPIGYFYDMILWATYFSLPAKTLLTKISSLKITHFIAAIISLTILIFIWIHRSKSWRQKRKTAILFSVFSVGLTEISLEFILILGFQVLYGYAFQYLAMIIAGYMLGLSLGSYHASRYSGTGAKPLNRFRTIQMMMAIYPLVVIGLLLILNKYNLSGNESIRLDFIFPLMTMVAGYIGGVQFILANSLYLEIDNSVKKVSGFLYGFDLLGSSLGTFLTSSFLVPIFGFFPTLGLFCLLNFCVWLVLISGD